MHIQGAWKLSRGQKVINRTKRQSPLPSSHAECEKWSFYEAVLRTPGCTLISGCTGTPMAQHKCNCRRPVLTRIFSYLHGLHLSQKQQSSCLVAVYSESNIKKGFRLWILIIPIWGYRYGTWCADDNLCMPLFCFGIGKLILNWISARVLSPDSGCPRASE